jgi:hypothetical protein
MQLEAQGISLHCPRRHAIQIEMILKNQAEPSSVTHGLLQYFRTVRENPGGQRLPGGVCL